MIDALTAAWWDTINIAHAASTRNNIREIAKLSLSAIALKNKICLYEYTYDGNLLIPIEQFIEQINILGGVVNVKSLRTPKNGDSVIASDTIDYVISWPNAALTISVSMNQSDDCWCYVNVSSLDKSLFLKIKELSLQNITQKMQGKVYMFASTESGPELKQISGKAGVILQRDNYMPNVLNDFDHIINDLQSNSPCGRIVIISGEPGGGKSFFIRGITEAVKNAMFIIIQPSMIHELMGPNFVPTLLEYHCHGQSIVLIIEDADSILINRQSDNINAITALLNLSDGLLGNMLDIKILATTNAKKLELDPAITRDGRCCRQVVVDELNRDKAQSIFNRLTMKHIELPHQKTYMLANIYKAHKKVLDKSINSKIVQEAKVGF